jgi:tetratricopeptide (TPR) repeat protein
VRKLVPFFIILSVNFGLVAQNNIDSVRLIYQNSGSSREKAESAMVLLSTYLSIDLDSAFFYGNIALEYSIEIGNDSLIAKSYQSMGNAAISQGHLDIALENYLAGISQFEEGRYPAISQGLTNNIGIIFDRKREYQKARDYYLKSGVYLDQLQDVLNKTERLRRQSILYMNIGATYESEEERDKAMEYYVKAKGLANKINDASQQATIYSNIGNLYLHQGKLALSEPNYLEALHIYDSLKDKSKLAVMYMRLGELYNESGDFDKAIESFTISARIAKETKSAITLFYASDRLYRLLAEKGDYEGAFYELVRNKELNDSLNSSEKAAALERMELEHDFEEEKMKLEDAQHVKTIWNYSLSGGILLLGVIFLLSLRNLKRKAIVTRLSNENLGLSNKHLSLEKSSLEEKLDFKNKELTTNVMYLMKKNEFINTVSDRLLAMRGLFKTENQRSINRIVLDLQKASEEDVWQEFETHFNRVHADFYDNLSEACPNLSLNERKLCAFVKLNLTTKEICAITHQTTNTLQVARTRLRKKLGLDSNDDLFSYLQNF